MKLTKINIYLHVKERTLVFSKEYKFMTSYSTKKSLETGEIIKFENLTEFEQSVYEVDMNKLLKVISMIEKNGLT